MAEQPTSSVGDGGSPLDKSTVLAARAELLARPLDTKSGDELATQLVGFDAGEGRFALSTTSVVAVIHSVPPTALPEQPAWLAGAVGVGGRVVTVVALDIFLGAALPQDPRSDRPTMIVVSDGAAEVALIVDRLAPADGGSTNVAPLPDGTSDQVARVVRGVVGSRHLLDAAGIVAAIRPALNPTTTDDSALPQHGGTTHR